MARLEDLTQGAAVRGILPDAPVEVVNVRWFGVNAIELTYKDAQGRPGNELLYRDREQTLEVAAAGRPWSFDGDGALLRLVSEAYRIRLAHLFDPLLAVHTSLVDPLPHQITAVYGEMLARQPLRFLLADDPGAGKTIMAGLLIKELLIRGDLHRCLIVCPGSLVEQWQEELHRRFTLPFEILTNDKLEAARTGNWLAEQSLVICRLDKLARDEHLREKLRATDWDLIVCDEAHKMAASYFGGEVKYTKRYQLGQLLGGLTRHFLLMTATPHNGKEADFQLFMALLDGDRFEGKYRDGVHQSDASDLMRRLVKEQLLTFDGTPLFPERIAYVVNYTLTPAELALYKQVTEYVRDQFNLADQLEGGRRGTVGFALTILQRRLASSPEAIYQSLRRRRERLEKRLREEQTLKRGAEARIDGLAGLPVLDEETLEDLDDVTDADAEHTEERLVDQASAAGTIRELEHEIAILQRLEAAAQVVRQGGADRKWEQFSSLLQENRAINPTQGGRFLMEPRTPYGASPDVLEDWAEVRDGRLHKLVIFTEHRDTLTYLAERIRNLLGRPEAVVTIHGGMGREERRKAQEAFTQDKEVRILVATDAAGEGINLQRAHLMVNYDLPWNPNRLEQRFGRIHRIGQTEVCHLWNLVAEETREGEVFRTLLDKLAQEREALGGQVFDVLGKLTFNDRPLRELLVEAIRYGDQPEVRARLHQVVEGALDRAHLEGLLRERALSGNGLDARGVRAIREEMERAEARRLQPHYIGSFFLEAFRLLGGTVHAREKGRYEITHVPASIRQRDRQIGVGEPVLAHYERVTFEKALVSIQGKPMAALISPGHPLLDATLDLILERYRELLKRGATLVDPADLGDDARVLCYLEHTIQDGRTNKDGSRRVVSRRVRFVEIDGQGTVRAAGYAPYLDYRPLREEERALLREPDGPDTEVSWQGTFRLKPGGSRVGPGTESQGGLDAALPGLAVTPAHPDAIRHDHPDAIRHDHPDARHDQPDAIRHDQPDAVLPNQSIPTQQDQSSANLPYQPTSTAQNQPGFSRNVPCHDTSVSGPPDVSGSGSPTSSMPGGSGSGSGRAMEARILDYAVTHLVPEHLAEVRRRTEALLERTRAAVNDRLTKEINYWDLRAQELRLQEDAGKTPKLNSARAQQRADELEARLQRRLAEIEQERRLAAAPPVVIGGALIVPAGLLARLQGTDGADAQARNTRRSELLAMAAVMAAERALGHEPRDVSAQKCGYDVESRVPGTGRLRFIEVKGRHPDARTVTLTRNEILTGLNKPDDFILAIVEVDGERVRAVRYVRCPFHREPDFAATSVNYDLNDLLSSSHDPE